MPNLNKNPEPSESGDSSGSQPPVPPQFGSPFDYDATADASLTETSAPTEKTPSTETTGTGPGWDTYSGVGNGPGWGNHPIYPPPTGTESTTAFPAADSDSTPNQPTAPYTSQESYAAQNYPAPDYSSPTQPRRTVPSTVHRQIRLRIPTRLRRRATPSRDTHSRDTHSRVTVSLRGTHKLRVILSLATAWSTRPHHTDVTR